MKKLSKAETLELAGHLTGGKLNTRSKFSIERGSAEINTSALPLLVTTVKQAKPPVARELKNSRPKLADGSNGVKVLAAGIAFWIFSSSYSPVTQTTSINLRPTAITLSYAVPLNSFSAAVKISTSDLAQNFCMAAGTSSIGFMPAIVNPNSSVVNEL